MAGSGPWYAVRGAALLGSLLASTLYWCIACGESTSDPAMPAPLGAGGANPTQHGPPGADAATGHSDAAASTPMVSPSMPDAAWSDAAVSPMPGDPDANAPLTDGGVASQPDATRVADATTPFVDASPTDAGNSDPDPPDAAGGSGGQGGLPDASDAPDGGVALVSPRNVIFLMADGYGAEQIEATRIFLNGGVAPLSFETLPGQAWVKTHNAREQVTDSAAAATAMATGHKVDNAVVSVAIPGDGADLRSVLEIHKARGRRTGMVTTHTPVTDGSPAGFGSHTSTRNNVDAIASDYFNETRPNILFGLTDASITASAAQAAGYTVVANAAQLAALDMDAELRVSGQFTEGTVPALQVMALAALDLLEESSQGFFLFVEQERTDTGGHANDLSTVLAAAVEFKAMVEQVLLWAQGRDDTLIVVGADHETGGLDVNEPNPQQGVVPSHSYATTGHSNADVRFFASGFGASRLAGTLDNTELFPLLAGYQSYECGDDASCLAGTHHDVLRASMPNAAASLGSTLTADLDDAGYEVQSLLGFTEISTVLPPGCALQAAHLVLHVSNGSTAGVRLHRMLSSWTTASTWNSFGGNGVQANGVEAAVTADAQSGATSAGVLSFDVTDAVSDWLSNPSSNHGWVLLGGSADGMGIDSPLGSVRPQLRLFCE